MNNTGIYFIMIYGWVGAGFSGKNPVSLILIVAGWPETGFFAEYLLQPAIREKTKNRWIAIEVERSILKNLAN